MATAIAVQRGIRTGTLGAWTPRALRRARARLPRVVLVTLGQDGVGVPAALGPRRGNGQSAMGNGRGGGGGAAAMGAVGVAGMVGDRAATCPNLRVRMTGRAHVAPGGMALGAAGELGVDVEATTDPCDRAHVEYRGELLASGRVAARAVAREYHRMYMVGPRGQRVSVETAIERVEACAHHHGLHRGPSVGEAVQGVLVRADKGQVQAAVRGVKLKEHYGESAAERAEARAMAEHELAVLAILAAGGAA